MFPLEITKGKPMRPGETAAAAMAVILGLERSAALISPVNLGLKIGKMLVSKRSLIVHHMADDTRSISPSAEGYCSTVARGHIVALILAQ